MRLRQPDAGTISLDGRVLPPLTPRRARAAGIGHVPEDRHRSGLVLAVSLLSLGFRTGVHTGERSCPLAATKPTTS